MMYFSEFSNFSEFTYIKLIYTLIIGIFGVCLVQFFKLAFYRHRLCKTLPNSQFAFFNIFGNALDIWPIYKEVSDINVAMIKLVEDYSKKFRDQKLFVIWIGYFPFLIINTAEALEEIINSNKASKKYSFYQYLYSWLGTGLLTSEGEKWKSRRKLLTPAFHFDILKDFLPVFNEQSHKLVRILQKEISKDSTDIIKPITLCSLDIICETTLGVSIGAQENKDSEYVKAVDRITLSIVKRFFSPLQWFETTFVHTPAGRQQQKELELLHGFTRSVIKEKKQKLLSGDLNEISQKKRKALMDLLLDHHLRTENFTEEDIREEVDTFTFEGHDTTAIGMSWALYLIGLYKDVQNKLHEEMDRIFGDDNKRFATIDDLNDMAYLSCVLKESQRIYPSVPYFGRETTEDVTVCGHRIPKGIHVSMFTYCLHRDETVFPDPEKFDPDRFLPENCINRNPFAYTPFSVGPRNCIGQRFAIMEQKTVLSHILRNFTLESLDSREEILPIAQLVLRPVKPIRLKIRPRKLDL